MKTLVTFVLMINILVVGLLLWQGNDRLNDFRNYHLSIANESVEGVAENTARFIQEKNRLVALFASNELVLIRKLAGDPENEDLHAKLAARVSAYFPSHFTFTLSDIHGEPLFEDFDGLIGEICRNDLVEFAEDRHPLVRIHPNTEAYHFDVMSQFGENEGILFISFHAEILGNIIKAAQTSGHELILALEQNPNLIEVTAGGARNTLDRLDFRLNEKEKARILKIKEVPDTSWATFDLNEAGLFTDFRNQLWQRSSIIIFIFIIASLLFIFVIHKIEQRRKLAERSRGEFLSTVSHELRTPLTAIHGALGLLTGGVAGELSTHAKNLATLASRNTTHMIHLVNDLLDLRKLESGDFSLEMQTCNLVQVVSHSLELNREFGAQYGVDYQFAASEQNIFIEANEQRIVQVMTNLLSNAAKYGALDSTVDVSIDIRDKLARVAVRDYGDSIPRDFYEHVFKKFSQADMKDNRESKGTGLGLSIVKHIIQLHHGRINFKSTPGKGTTFYFDLPIIDNL